MPKPLKPQPQSGDTGWMIIVMVVLLVAIVAVILWQWKKAPAPSAPPPSPTATEAATQPNQPLITDDRILYGGLPRPAPGAGNEVNFEVLKNSAYMVGYSETRRDPLWVSYRVFRNPKPFNLPRPAGFLADTRSANPVKDTDFVRSGYDRGHMAPNASIARDFGAQAQIETFLLTNICPQSPQLNQHVWARLEDAERKYADLYEEVWIIDGPVFGDLNRRATSRLASGVSVPDAFFKILVDEQAAPGGRPRVMSVIMPQNVQGSELPQQYLTSVREIEKETHLDFFWKLDAATQEQLETKVWPMWSTE